MANDVTFQRSDYLESLYAWNLVDDVVAGSSAVKAKKDQYLPKPNEKDVSTQNATRYKQYVARAVFYNAVGHTLRGLVGAAFRKQPQIEVPEGISYVVDDIDGAGVSIYQQSQSVLREVLKKGRAFLLADYPQTQGQLTRAQMEAGGYRSTLARIQAENVVNWRMERFGARYKLSLVVIRELVDEATPDGFGADTVTQYRVLRYREAMQADDGADLSGYTQEIWRKNTSGDWVIYQPAFQVKDASGKAWDEIPGIFVGANNNDADIDPPPLYDMAELNVAHYRNSADYEEGVFMHGQGTLWLDVGEISQDDFDKANPGGVMLGARGGLVLGKGGKAGLVQMEANSAAHEAMEAKEKQMVAIGARLLEAGGAVKTATEAQGELEEQHSVLSLAAVNVSEAYMRCLGWMGRFMGVSGDARYEINQEFTKPNLDAQMLSALVQLWMSGRYPDADLWGRLRYYGLIDPEKTDEDIKDELSVQDPGLGLEGETIQ